MFYVHGKHLRSGGAKVLGKLPESGRPTIWMIVGQGPIALAVGAAGGCLDIFTLRYFFSLLFLPLSGRRPDIVVVDLLFYVHGKHLRSCRDGQLT